MDTVFKCAHCGRPIGGIQTWLGSNVYHYECTVGPSMPLTYAPNPPGGRPGCHTADYLTEDDVRRIVREELKRGQP